MEEESVSVKKASEVNDPDIDLQDVDTIFNRMSSAVLGSGDAVINMPSLPGLVDVGGGTSEHRVHSAPALALQQHQHHQQGHQQLQTPRPSDLASNADTADEPSGLRLTHWASFRTTATAAAKPKPKANTKTSARAAKAAAKASAKQANAGNQQLRKPARQLWYQCSLVS